jgi:rSAM/selenodomain-associated transferase 2
MLRVEATATTMRVSVVIPTLNEATTIVSALSSLADQGADEVVVADASSPDGTAALACRWGATVVDSPRGRGVQQNRGAAVTSGDVLVFLHADCRLESGALDGMRRALRRHPRVPGGCFRMRVDASRPVYRAIESAADIRAGFLGIPYGDQGIFARRWAFERVGGFPELPLMEDVFFSLRLRRLGRMLVAPQRILVSSRRWERRGVLQQSLANWFLTASAALGVPTRRLARHYPVIR